MFKKKNRYKIKKERRKTVITKQNTVMGTLYAGNKEYYAIDTATICDQDGNDLPMMGWAAVENNPVNGIYPAPVIIINAPFVSMKVGVNIEHFVDPETPEETVPDVIMKDFDSIFEQNSN